MTPKEDYDKELSYFTLVTDRKYLDRTSHYMRPAYNELFCNGSVLICYRTGQFSYSRVTFEFMRNNFYYKYVFTDNISFLRITKGYKRKN